MPPASPDIAVVGAGVFGLSAALAARRAGLTVRLFEAQAPGAGASGGPVGALAPHGRGHGPLPEFQHRALSGLPAYAAALAELSGLDPGYARPGRIAALLDDAALSRAHLDAGALNARWGDGAAEVHPGRTEGFAAGIAGVLTDTVTARLTPSLWLGAHIAALRRLGTEPEIARALAVKASGTVVTDRGAVTAGHVVVAAGWSGAPLLAAHGIRLRGMKGQAARMEPALPPDAPVMTAPGLYAVAHDGFVGIGSTAENNWQNQDPDEQLEDVVARVCTLIPALRDAKVTARWSAIRPRGPGSGPLAGPVPDAPRILAATGGHRIGFALAHQIAHDLTTGVTSGEQTLPVEFLPAVT